MASTQTGKRLTEAHRLAQARLGARTVNQMLAAWPVLDLSDMDGTFPRWLRVVQPLLAAQYRSSARLAGNYLMAFRGAEVGSSAWAPTLVEEIAVEQVATSMLVTGPAAIRSALAAGTKWETAIEVARVGSARSAMRLALAGGRETITTSVARDRRALGWARTTSGSPCSFCAMAASRGPVYDEGTVRFEAHDGCSCSAEPVYDRDAQWPAGARELQSLWQESTRGLSDKDARNAFRSALAAR